ncbi:MAG: fibronectin type III domain-containing protein [Patescibacteria group bacterium]
MREIINKILKRKSTRIILMLMSVFGVSLIFSSNALAACPSDPSTSVNTGTYTSGVIDMTSSVAFTALNWSSTTPTNTCVALQFRSGPTGHTTVDGSWTAWSSTMTTSGSSIAGSSGQYAQYQVIFGAEDINNAPSINSVTINANVYNTATLSGTGLQTNAGGEAIWTNLAWNASDIPTGTSIKFNTRTSTDGSTWSAWGSDITGVVGANSQDLAIPDSQYLDIQLTLTGGDVTPTLDDFTLSYTINGPPAVSSVTASQSTTQASYGTVDVGYTLSDPDNDTATVSYFYGSGITQSGTFSDSDTTLNTNNTTTAPDSGTLLIDDEFIHYTGKTDTSFTGLTRAYGSTKAVSHTAATNIYLACNTVTGDGTKDSGAGGHTYSGTWNVATDLPNTYIGEATLKVVAHDGQLARMIGSAASSNFVIDTKTPTLGATPLAITQGKPRTNDRDIHLAEDASDNSALSMMISQSADFTGAEWEAYAATKVLNVTGLDGTKTIYIKYKDIYGNTSVVSSDSFVLDTTSLTPTGTILIDGSDMTNGIYQIILSWSPVAQTDFSLYSIERSINNATSFSQITTYTNKAVNAYNDTELSKDNTYYYRIRSQDDLGNWSAYSPIINMTPAGVDQTPPSITGPDPNVNPNATAATVSWLTNEISDTFVEYGLTNSYGSTQGKVDSVMSHNVTLVGLIPETGYHFRVRSRDLAGNNVVSGDFTFTTIAGADHDPPQITGPNPSADPNATTAVITWLTDELADSYVEYGTTIEYGTIQGKIEAETIHAVTLVGLLPETNYHFRVRSTDLSTNSVVGNDFTFKTLAVEEKTTPPTITGATAQKEGADPEEVTIVWTTNKATTSQVKYGTEANQLNLLSAEDKAYNTAHYVHITKLKPNTKYYYQVVSTDKYGNQKIDETKYFVTSQTGVGSPKISAVETTDITLTSAIITWETTVVATSVIEYGIDNTYGSKIEDQSLGSTTKHLIRLKDLKEGVKYHYRVQGQSTGGVLVSSDDYVFSSLTKPTISDINVKDIGSVKAVVVWKTDTNSDSFVDYGTTTMDVSQGRSEEVKDHAVTLSGLIPATEYKIQIKSRDKYGNQAISDIKTFKTVIDTTAPTIKDLKSETSIITDSDGSSKAQAIISWSTDEPATSQVKYAAGVTTDGNYTNSTPEDPTLTTSHIVIITSIKPSSTYHMKIVSKDASNNIGVSDDYTVLTQGQEKSLVQYIIQILEQRFSWINGFKLF